MIPGIAMADGGALQWRERAGPYTVTVFTTPVPMRAGPVDFSVMVQRTADNDVNLDAAVELHLTKGGEMKMGGRALHSLATNKLLYSVDLNLPASGVWLLEVRVSAADGNASVAKSIRVLEAEPAVWTYWPYFAAVPAFVGLFIANRYLKKSARG